MVGRKPGSENGHFAEKRRQAAITRWSDPEQKRQHSERMQRLMALPEGQEMMRRRNADNWARPGERERRATFYKEKRRNRWRQRIRETLLGYKHDESTLAKKAVAYVKYAMENPTRAECILYCLLRIWGLNFLRQQAFGRYIVDAYVPSLNLAIEADVHFGHWDETHKERRDNYLRDLYDIFVWHLDGKQLYSVWEEVLCRKSAQN